MEELRIGLAVIIAQIEKEQLQAQIKEELSAVGKKELWKIIERYAEVNTAVKLYDLVKD